jgi:hypothetical protein
VHERMRDRAVLEQHDGDGKQETGEDAFHGG